MKYVYQGAVMIFDTVVCRDWRGETSAPSFEKAKSNLVYQAKKAIKVEPWAKITLTGKIKEIN